MAMIRFYKPALFRKDMDAVLQTMVDEKIGPGDRRKEFERSMASYLSRKNGFALRSYVDCIRLAIESLSLAEGSSFALSVLTPRIYIDIIKSLGFKYILVDTDEDFMPSYQAICERSSEIDAVIVYEPVCQVFRNCDEFRSLNLPIIEDISASFGSSYDSAVPGAIGSVVICASEENAIVSTGGGAVLLSDDVQISDRIKKRISVFSHYIEMPDMNAALGIVQLAKIETVLQRRTNIYRTFQQAAMKSSARIFGSSNMVDFAANGFGFSVIVNNKPDETISFAMKYQVSARKTFSDAAGSRFQDRFDLYPNAIAPLTRAISFPIYPFLSAVEIETIQKVIGHLH